MIDPKVAVPDDVVVEALLKDAKRFKSKWELNVNEPTRSKPNTRFLKRTLNNLVKTNQDRMRKPRRADSIEREIRAPSSDREPSRSSANSLKPSTSKSLRDKPVDGEKSRRKSKNCSKSKHRSPSQKRKSKHKREKSTKSKHKKSKK